MLQLAASKLHRPFSWHPSQKEKIFPTALVKVWLAGLCDMLTYRAGGIVQGKDGLPTPTPLSGIIRISVAFSSNEIFDIQKMYLLCFPIKIF